jgi:hypothetical protein
MNLLGLLIRGLLASNLADPVLYARARTLRGDVRVDAGTMAVTLRFDGAGVVIAPVGSERPRARVRGSMSALLGMVAGKGIVAPVLTGAVRIGGNPFMLLRMLPLIQAPLAAAALSEAQERP